jgi:Domain of unknown function (DUF4835)
LALSERETSLEELKPSLNSTRVPGACSKAAEDLIIQSGHWRTMPDRPINTDFRRPFRLTMKTATFILVLSLVSVHVPPAVIAQEVDCTVQVNTDAVPTTNKDLLNTFAADVRTYLSNYNWGGGDASEKVKCTLNIFVQSVIGENRYSAQVFIGSQRPRFNTNQSTAVVRIFDELWEFTYIKDRPINHNAYSFSDLASFLDFYMYVIMGYDYDTYDWLSGTPLFQKAADIARMGQSSSQKGWQVSTTSYSRSQLIDEILNAKFAPVRGAYWTYHFAGLDSLSTAPARAYQNIIGALESIDRVRKGSDPRNLIIKTFFEAKSLELAEIFKDYPDPSIYVRLSQIDPSHQKTYEEYRTGGKK